MIHALPPAPHAVAPAAAVRESVLGRSARGRPIRLTRIGPSDAPTRVLVVGSIHGNEPAGAAVVRELRRHPAPPGTQLWIVRDLNPDGTAAGTRQNARGVDLNRNFPDGWRAQGRPFDTYHSGARPLSEPESRLVARLIRRLRPAATLWYHQALTLVDRGTVADPGLVSRYARISGLPVARLGFLPGVATRWQNRTQPGSSAFVVELPSGFLTPAAARRHARAARAVSTSIAGQPSGANWLTVNSAPCGSRMSAERVQSSSSRATTVAPSRSAPAAVASRSSTVKVTCHRGSSSGRVGAIQPIAGGSWRSRDR